MFAQCGLCGGPSTTGHYCPAMVRNCLNCGGHGLRDVTHICPGLSRSCRNCGVPGGADFTHVCQGLSWPRVTIIYPQIVPPPTEPFVTYTTYEFVGQVA
jgi:hypothetical protein